MKATSVAAVGQVLKDTYRLERTIGTGGMGVVFEASHTRVPRRFALKFLSDDAARDPTAFERFRREAHIASALGHDNIVQVFDFDRTEQGLPYMVLELLVGQDLAQHLADAGPLSLAQTAIVLEQVASGLAAAHAQGIVHRDLKPANLFVCTQPDGSARIKLLDFGISKIASASSSATRTGAVLGTLNYMSPEQADGKLDEIDQRTDVFALAAILHECLSGRRAFQAATPMGTLYQICHGDPAPLQVADLPAGVEAAIRHGLARDRAARTPTVLALRDEFLAACPARGEGDTAPWPLERPRAAAIAIDGLAATDHAPPSPATPPTALPATTWRPRRGARAWPIALAALVAAGAIGGGLLARRRGEATATVATAATPPPRAISLTDQPAVGSRDPAAAAAYAEGVQALRDGALRTAIARFARATELDPTMAAAQLRASLYGFYASTTRARERYQRAAQHRRQLTPHDQVLLDAIEPQLVREPIDHGELERRLRAATRAFPRDAELAALLASAQLGHGDDAATEIGRYDVALALDPAFGLAYAYKAQTQAYWADVDGARTTLAACLAAVPQATLCQHLRNNLDAYAGRCAELEDGARALRSIDPAGDQGYRSLATASYALGRPLATTLEDLTLARERLPEGDRAAAELEDRFAIAVLTGEFDAAEQAVRALEAAIAATPGRAQHARVAGYQVDLYQEIGEDARAADVAASYLDHREAWVADPRGEDFAIPRDPVPRMLAAELRAGRLSAASFAQRRDAWLADGLRDVMPRFVPFLWLHGVAGVVRTPTEAARALELLPRYAPIPTYAPRTLALADVGHTFALAGRDADALGYLRQAAGSCVALEHPFAHTRAELWLGQLLERTGAIAEACTAYGVVLARWGGARRSVTAASARERVAALRCAAREPIR